MPVVGIAEVLVQPVFNGVQRTISREMGPAAQKAGRSAGARGGKAFTQAFAGVVGGLAVIPPVAGAAGAAVLAASGNVITFTASLGSLAGVAALVPAGLMAIGAGAGVLVTAFSGVGEALKTAVEAGNAISTANPRLAAMDVEDAMLAITVAEESAAEAVEDAARRVADAKRGLREVTLAVADAQRAAAKSVEMAERDEAKAARDVIEAQKDLVEAREKAASRVNEVGRALDAANDTALASALAYKQAVDLYNTAKANPSTSGNELSWMESNAARALASDKDAQLSVIELREQHSKAQAEATAGSEKILAAEQRLADERQAQADAIQARKDAQADVIKQEQEGAQRIADAQQDITDATRQAEKAQIDSARSVQQAHRNLERVQMQQADTAAQAGQKSAQAMGKLTPAAQAAVVALLAVKAQLGAVRRIAQENFFTGFAAPLLTLAGSVMPQLATGVGAIASAMGAGAQTYMGALNSALGGGVLESLLMGIAKSTTILNQAIDPVVQSFTTLGVVGMDYMPRLAQSIADMATRFDGFIQTAAADGSLVAWIDGGIQSFKDLWSVAGSVVGIFGSLNKAAEAGGAASSLAGLAAGLRDIDAAMQGQVFQTTMAKIFSGAEAGSQGLLAALGPIGDAFVRGAPAMAEFLRLGGEIAGTFLGGVFTALSDPAFGAGLITFMEGLQRGVASIVPLLPGLTGAFGSLLTALAPIAEVVGPTLVQVLTFMTDGLAAVIGFLSPFLALVAGSPVTVGLLVGVLATAAITMKALTLAGNIQSTAMRLWAVSVAIVKGALYVLSLQWIRTAAAAVVSGAQTAYVWALYRIDAIKSAAVHVAQSARVVAAWVAMSAAAVASGIKTAAVWVGSVVASAASGAASFVMSAGRVVGGWVLMGVQSMIHAARMAAAWLIAMGPVGWVIAAVVGLAAIVIANWDKISKWTKDMWEKHVKPIFDALGNFITKNIPDAFNQGVGFIKTAWDKLIDIAKKPVKFVVDTVINDGLIGAFNTVAGILPGMAKLPRVELPKGFARGGVLPGQSSWRNGDDQMVPMRRGEGVYVSEVMRDPYERARLYAMNKAAIMGRKASEARALFGEGFAKGGILNPLRQMAQTQGYNRIHKGIDLAASVGTPVFATEPGRVSWSGPGVKGPGVWGGNEVHVDGASGVQSWFAHLSSMAVRVGEMVRAGQQIALSGNTGISSGPHLHFGAFAGGWPNDINPYSYLSGAAQPSGKDAGGFDPLGMISGLAGKIVGQLKSAFPGAGFMVDAVAGIGGKLIGSVADWVKGKLGFGSATGTASGAPRDPALYDLGGILPPGISQVVNRTGKPEAILNPRQWADIHRLAALRSGDGGGQTNNFEINQVDDPTGTATAVARRLRAIGT